MKYAIITVLAAAVCLILGIAVVSRFTKKHRVLKGSLFGALLLILIGLGYLMIYHHAQDQAIAALNGSELVRVEKLDKGYHFDGPGDDAALIFYPGAKVEAEAYAPLLLHLAEEGMDTFLVRMPMRIAFLDPNAAGSIMNEFSYEHWLLAGHSLGGAVAASYASAHPDDLDGLVLLAAYPTKQLETPLLSIYGSEDGCLERNVYDKDRIYWPETSIEVIIEGGNHAQFGDYGKQKGDKEARISAEEQWEQAVMAVIAFRDTHIRN